MKNAFLAALIFLSFDAYAAGVPGAPVGPVTSAETADLVGAVTTINGQCVTPTAGCSAGQFAAIKVGGRNSISVTFIGANFTGTFAPYVSFDNRATWVASSMKQNPAAAVNSYSSSFNLSGSSATIQYAVAFPYGGVTDVMVASTAAVTNTATLRLVATNTLPALSPAYNVKGTQSGLAQTVQEFKDAGRTYVAIVADGVTPAVSETLITFTKTVADTQTTTQTSYTITTAKTFRLQVVCASLTAGAAANRVRVALRLNTAGACIASSPILLPVIELAPNYGTATAAEGGANGCVSIPDGLDIAGNGTKAICLSEAATAASGTLTVNLVGFEY